MWKCISNLTVDPLTVDCWPSHCWLLIYPPPRSTVNSVDRQLPHCWPLTLSLLTVDHVHFVENNEISVPPRHSVRSTGWPLVTRNNMNLRAMYTLNSVQWGNAAWKSCRNTIRLLLISAEGLLYEQQQPAVKLPFSTNKTQSSACRCRVH